MFVNEFFISPVKDDTGTVVHFLGIQHMTLAQEAAVPAAHVGASTS